MSRKDPISGKGPMTGNNRSKAMNATKRRWDVNLQTYTIYVNGEKKKIRVSAKTWRTMKNKGLIDVKAPK